MSVADFLLATSFLVVGIEVTRSTAVSPKTPMRLIADLLLVLLIVLEWFPPWIRPSGTLVALAAVARPRGPRCSISTIECRQFTAYNTDNRGLIVTYYLGDNDPPVLYCTKITPDTAKLLEFL